MKKLISLCALFALSTIMAFAADVTGTWKGEAGAKGPAPTFTFKQDGSTLVGKTTMGQNEVEISNAKIDGEKIWFEVTVDMGEKGKRTTKYSGIVSGGTMKLSAEGARGTREVVLTKQ
jgi:hypothetical protein